ncbi:hypothetical protein F4801DRAFT_604332 [Xylaria longipes]|nr:hypothetical protein F4801DRAFT_604332 [Xylaria longipes]
MAESNICNEGSNLPFTGDACPKISSPELQTNVTPSDSIPARGSVPRAPRFSKLSDAYLKITSRQVSNETFRKASNQSDPSTIASTLASPVSSPVATPRLVKSQNDLQTPASVSATPSSMKIDRRTSFDSIELFEDLLPQMGRQDKKHLSLSEEIEHELLDLKTRSNDTTDSTIERILAQYDVCTPGIKVEHGNPREYRMKVDSSLSRPPQDSLPDLPAIDIQPVSVRQREYDSPVPDSSITDSEHLLDAEAQAYELEEARRALVPSPLNIAYPRSGIEIQRDQQHDACDNRSDLTEGAICTNDLFTRKEVQGYKTYLQPPMERDISQTLRHLGGNTAHSIGTFCSSDVGDYVPRHIRPQGTIFSPTRLPKVGGEKPLRQIKVVIGRNSETGQNTEDAQDDVKHDRHDMHSEDGDWVTETTSDAGFGLCNNALPEQPLTKRFKRAGSSLADYSDDGNESTMDRFGSRERIIPHPAGGEKYRPSDIQRLNGSKLAFLLPRQHNAFLRNANRLWASTTQQGPGQLRPHILSQKTNPNRDIGSRRLVFDFDQNAPPKYEFRDSISDYEPAKASTKSNCGINQYDTYGSLPSSVSKFGEDRHSITTDPHLDQSADFDGNRNPSNRGSRQSNSHQSSHDSQDTRLSIYAADRRRQLEELELQEFAAASSYYEPPSASSVRSKFNFELLPLDLARHKKKLQRSYGETNEIEPATTRLKRKQSSPSINLPASTLERPAKAYFTSRDLSINFSTPNWRMHNLGSDASADTQTPFSMDRPDEIGSSATRKYQKSTTLGSLDPPSSFGMPSIVRRPGHGRKERHPTPARSRHRLKPPPSFVAPDDYVSDRANRTRQLFFYIIAVLSILPFVGVLALGGAFREALKWATCSEVDRLTARQRRFLKWMLFAESVIYTSTVVTVVVYFVVKSKVQN